ncbi:MAG: hypothetical protein RLZZ399_889 [Verrucomicrobiota bacterium]|jgi:polar amino acid transport system ATP-binding protein
MKISISNLTKYFAKQRVLDSVSLHLENIRSLVLMGPSGGGKSTLLRLIAALETPDAGSITLNHSLVPQVAAEQIPYRRTIGVVFQAFNLFPHLSALENIALPLTVVQQRTRSEAREIAVALLKRFQLENHASQKPATLSGGQRQRIAIARALATRPSVLLMDEPTSALDPEMTSEVLEMIQELRHEGRDLILVTHEAGFAKQAADTVALLSGGKIVEYGTPQQVLEAPNHEISRSFFRKILKY